MQKNLQKKFIKLTLVLSIIFGGFSTVYSQAPYNIIQGKVWIENDNSVDGLMQTGERKLSGIVVTMFAADDEQPKGNAMTDINGSYNLENYEGIGNYTLVFDFPRDGFGTDETDCVTLANVGSDLNINSRATYDDINDLYSCAINITSTATINANIGLLRRNNTITNCGMHEAQVAWPVPTNINVQKIPAFISTPSTGATFWSSIVVHNPDIKYENLSLMADDMTLAVGVNARIFRADLPTVTSTSIALTSSYEYAETLAPYDGTADYSGASGNTLYNKSSNKSDDKSVTATVVNTNYRGGGSIAFPATMIASTSITGGGNLSTQVTTSGSAGVCMVYKFGINPLPITLVSFNASKDKNGYVKLNWVTSNEENNLGFDVEYSADGKIWDKLDFVRTKSSNGTSVSALSYSFLHTHAAKGVNFYRLKQIDLNGNSTFSNIATINVDTKNSEVRIFPNPMGGSGTLNIDGLASKASIEIFNMAGTKLYNINSNNNNTQKIDMSNYASGVYNVIVKDMDSGESIIQKVVK